MKNLTHSMQTILLAILALVMVTTKAMGQDRAEMTPKKFSALENGRAFTREALLKPCDCDQASFTFAPTRQWIAVDGFESKEDTTENSKFPGVRRNRNLRCRIFHRSGARHHCLLSASGNDRCG